MKTGGQTACNYKPKWLRVREDKGDTKKEYLVTSTGNTLPIPRKWGTGEKEANNHADF